jgi:DNA-binding MarR family transcriptional regulator
MPRFKQGAFSPWPPSVWSGPWRPDYPCAAIDLDFHLPRALHFAREAGLARLRPHLRRRGVTEAGWRLLRVLEAAGRPLTATEIARLIGGTDTNARLNANRLIARGQVAWRDDPGPGRRVNDWRAGPWLALAAGGTHTLARLHHACRVAYLAPPFDDRNRKMVVRGLAHLIRAMGATLPVPLDPVTAPTVPGEDPVGWDDRAMHDLDLGLPLLLKHTRAAVLSPVRALLAAHALTEPQWRILRLLEHYRKPVFKKAVIRAGGFLGPEARHAMDSLLRRKLIRFDDEMPRVPAWKRKRRKRFQIELGGAGRVLMRAVEDAEYATLGPVMVRIGAGAVLDLNPLLSELGQAWLWTPDGPADATGLHPLHAEYARQDASAREWTVILNARNKAARRARWGWGPNGEMI